MEIEYLGRKINSQYFDGSVNREEVSEVQDNYYQTTKEEALKQLEGILLNNKVAYNKIHGYYFEKIANNSKKHNTKWSINELLANDKLVQTFINKTKANPKVFKETETLTRRFRTVMRIGGSSNIGVLTTFPIKHCLNILKTNSVGETKGKTYIDPCCGWGTRMITSAILDMDYIGFDVNSELIEKLEELGKDIQQIKPEFNFKIYKQGSQYFVPELVNQADIIFTSPPYFNLEIYNNDLEKEDTLNGSFEDWLSKFMYPMLENMKQYAKPNAKIMINIKDFKKYNIIESIITYAQENGFIIHEFQELKTNKRVNTTIGGLVKNDEPIIVLEKIKS